MKTIFTIALAFYCLYLAGETQAQTAYTIQDLGSAGGYPTVTGLNNNGEVVGNTYNNNTNYYFSYSNGTLQTQYLTGNFIGNINDSGLIPTVSANTQAELYNIHTGQTNLVGPTPPTKSGAYTINQKGDSAGLATPPGGQGGYAALFRNGQTTPIGPDASHTISPYIATSLNSSDQVVGRASDAAGNNHPFLYSNGVTTDLGALPNGKTAGATGINDRGDVVGYSEYDSTGGQYHPFLYHNGKMQDLGTFGGPSGDANGINNAGVVVGSAQYLGVGDPYAPFIYNNGVMRNLFNLIPDGSAWSEGFGDAINDKGQIAGEAYHNGRLVIFLATPVATPAPGSLLTCSVGVGVLLLAARLKRAA